MNKTCTHCPAKFEVTDSDKMFYEKMYVPAPNKCPSCRFQNRIAFRNEQRFYNRSCDMCHKPTISTYSQDKDCVVYCSTCWWSDAYDPLAYGQDFDFSRPFFEQYNELARHTPKPAIMNMKSENSTYTNYSSENNNCYILVGSAFCEDCYYGYRLFTCKNVVDCYDLQKSELCYECTQSRNIYNCTYCDSCENSSNLTLCSDCTGCFDCFGCVNLRNKKFHIFNQPYSEEDYKEHVAILQNDFEESKRKFKELKLTLPYKANHIINCENCSGDQLSMDKNCMLCFNLHNSEECSYLINGDSNKHCSDVNFIDMSELAYNSMSCQDIYNTTMANLVWFSSDTSYCTNSFNCDNLFGCVGMKRNSYCILNKKYSPEEYEIIKGNIIKHMRNTGEYGEYYPMAMSPFAYNETVAMEYFPMTKDQALTKGLKWKEDIYEIPKQIPEDAIVCEVTKKPFKVTQQEFAFYKKMGLSLPKLHPFQRHQNRMAPMLKSRLFDCSCVRCGLDIQTAYSPERLEKVYCEKCYLAEVY